MNIHILVLLIGCRCALSLKSFQHANDTRELSFTLERGSEFTIGPVYVPAREIAMPVVASVFRKLPGATSKIVMQSSQSKLYPGVARRPPDMKQDLWIEDPRFRGLGITPDMWISSPEEHTGYLKTVADLPELRVPWPYQRNVVVYVPAGVDTSKPAPFIVVNDGEMLASLMPPMLETLIGEGRIPAMIALFVSSGGDDAQGSERGVEYDPVNGDYADFIETEVLPLVSRQLGLSFTKDPNSRAVMGFSSGGICAFSMAFHRPQLFRRVLAYSPSFVNQQYPVDPAYPHGGWDYHSGKQLILNSEHKPLRVGIYSSEHDLGWPLGNETYRNFRTAHRRMADALKQKGYDYRYTFCKGASHVDMLVIANTLPSAMEWLWQGFQP